MRADRLLAILMLLQAHGRLAGPELARRLEVSGRTIQRDMDALGAAGVPVVADRGAQGGWRLLDGWSTDLTAFAAPELQALLLAPPDRVLADLGLAEQVEAARTKLVAAAPAALRAGAAHAAARLHVDPAGWRRAEEAIPCFAQLREAVFRDRRVAVVYEKAGGEAVARVLDPLGLVAKGGTWYVVAAVDGEPRTFRASRVREAVVGKEPVARPAGFDLAGFWAASMGGFVAALPRFRLAGRAAPAVVPRLAIAGRYSRVEAVGEPGADGWCEVVLGCETEAEAIEVALGFGPGFLVTDPAAVRAAVAARAAATAALYAARSPAPSDGGP